MIKGIKENGWSYIIDDEGGGYYIGRQALRAIFRAYDGRGEDAILTSKILNHFSSKSLKMLC